MSGRLEQLTDVYAHNARPDISRASRGNDTPPRDYIFLLMAALDRTWPVEKAS
jgi:hypothetical protein